MSQESEPTQEPKDPAVEYQAYRNRRGMTELSPNSPAFREKLAGWLALRGPQQKPGA